MEIKEWLREDSKIGIDIWENKYRAKGESLDEWFDRVSGGDEDIKKLIKDKKFLFGGRTLSNRGLNQGSLSNCYSSGFCRDSYKDILNLNTDLGLTYKAQGGQGVSLSQIRPKDAPIGDRYKSDGIIPFLELFNKTTEVTSQAGSRKGALLASLDIRHKQAEEFIKIKSEENSINKANLSMEIDDEFMEFVEDFYETGNKLSMHEEREYSGNTISYDLIPSDLFKLLAKTSHDWAEPGVMFTNEFRNYNLMEFHDGYNVETSNPSLRKGTKIMTSDGIFNVEDLENKEFIVQTLDETSSLAKCFLSGKDKDLYKITLENGVSYFSTKEHKWAVKNKEYYEKITTDKLKKGDMFPVTFLDKLSNGTIGTYSDGLFVGFWYGDGSITLRKDGRYQYGITVGKKDADGGMLRVIQNKLSEITNKPINYSTRNRGGEDWYEFACGDHLLHEYFQNLGVTSKYKLSDIFYTDISEDFRRGFVDGIISSDGSITVLSEKDNRITLNSSNIDFATEISDLFWWYGIRNSIYHTETHTNFTTDKRKYFVANVTIGKYGAERFKKLFSLTNSYKKEQLDLFSPITKRSVLIDNIRVANVELTTLKEDVWDICVYDESHTFRLNHCITGNCGEQPLKKDGSCTLGSLDLSRFIINEYTSNSFFDFDSFKSSIYTSIRALDDVLDENLPNHPLKKQRKASKNYRNIGLGIFGLATALFKMKISYGSEKSKEFVDKIFYEMFREAVFASNSLAKEKGVFPKYNDSVFKSRIIKNHFTDDEIEELKIDGLRNCSLLSIAPSGSIGTMMMRSTGCEPEYAIKYNRKTHNLDDSYDIYCDEAQYYLKLTGEKELPDYFVCSKDVHWKDRVDMQAVIQRHIDTGISSTVNLPNETSVEEVEQLYLYAWKKKIKGITIFRDGCKREGILTTGESGKQSLDVEFNHISPPTKEDIGETIGFNDKKKVACGSLYLTVGKDPKTQNIVEMYINKSKSGVCEAMSQGMSRLVSTCLRSGVSVEYLCDQLIGIKCPACTNARKDGKKVEKSCPHAIGSYILEKYKQGTIIEDLRQVDKPPEQIIELVSVCPECGEKLAFVGGCVSCTCGYSKCE